MEKLHGKDRAEEETESIMGGKTKKKYETYERDTKEGKEISFKENHESVYKDKDGNLRRDISSSLITRNPDGSYKKNYERTDAEGNRYKTGLVTNQDGSSERTSETYLKDGTKITSGETTDKDGNKKIVSHETKPDGSKIHKEKTLDGSGNGKIIITETKPDGTVERKEETMGETGEGEKTGASSVKRDRGRGKNSAEADNMEETFKSYNKAGGEAKSAGEIPVKVSSNLNVAGSFSAPQAELYVPIPPYGQPPPPAVTPTPGPSNNSEPSPQPAPTPACIEVPDEAYKACGIEMKDKISEAINNTDFKIDDIAINDLKDKGFDEKKIEFITESLQNQKFSRKKLVELLREKGFESDEIISLLDSASSEKPLSNPGLFQITPFPTVQPNPASELEEILSLNWGSNKDEVGCYGEVDYALIVDHTNSYGPYDFFIDKEEYIYIADSYNHRVLKFKDKKLYKTYSYVKESPALHYPSFYTDNKGNLYVIEIFGGEIRKNKVLRLDKDNIFLYEDSDLTNQFVNCEIKFDEHSGICKEMQFKDEKMEITFPLKPIKKYDFEFLGIDEAYNFYFVEKLIKHYSVSEKDNIEGVILYGPFEGYMVNQGIILYKITLMENLLKKLE